MNMEKHTQYTRQAASRYSYNGAGLRTGKMKRKRSILTSKYTCFTAALAILIIFTICIYGILTVSASNKENDEKLTRYYTSITVKADDTLWNIAQKYAASDESSQSYINNIKSLNNMTDDTIYSGQDILVYYYSNDVKK